MYEDVIQRLQAFGYTVLDTDDFLINFAIEKVIWKIKNRCNLSEIPEGLYNTAVDMVCGEFLSAKKGSGQLEGFDIEEAVKQIREGDTTITYAISDGKASLDEFINGLMNSGNGQFASYRKFKW